MSSGIVFPGMGPPSSSGYAYLGKFLATDPYARRLRKTADEVLGYSLMDRYRTADADYSEYSQVAFLTSCIALIQRASDQLAIESVVCTGPSFGGKTALAFTGVLPFPQAVLLTARLARCEEEYFQSAHQDAVTQSVARMPEAALSEILKAMTARGEWQDISCHIDQDFFMVSMRSVSLDRFLREVRAAGGLPLYAMRPPMHCAAFGSLRVKAEEEVLRDFQFGDPRLPIIADQDGSTVVKAEGARAMVLDGFVRPVLWPRAVQAMKDAGVTKVFVAGPDSLFSRVRCTTENFEVIMFKPDMALQAKKHSMA